LELAQRLRELSEAMGVLSRGKKLSKNEARAIWSAVVRSADTLGASSSHLCALLTTDDIVEIMHPNEELEERQRAQGLDQPQADDEFVLVLDEAEQPHGLDDADVPDEENEVEVVHDVQENLTAQLGGVAGFNASVYGS
jgi:hypothetical protein